MEHGSQDTKHVHLWTEVFRVYIFYLLRSRRLWSVSLQLKEGQLFLMEPVLDKGYRGGSRVQEVLFAGEPKAKNTTALFPDNIGCFRS